MDIGRRKRYERLKAGDDKKEGRGIKKRKRKEDREN